MQYSITPPRWIGGCCSFLLAVLLGFIFAGCTKDETDIGKYDPNLPVQVTDFYPKEGGARTRLIVYGSNFGTDTSLVTVKIGGKKAKLINVKSNALYCITPEKCYEGSVEVIVGDANPAIAPLKYNYHRQVLVSTLCGYVDELGNGKPTKEGPFEDCGSIEAPCRFSFDPKNKDILYFTQDKPGEQAGLPMRYLDLKKRWIYTGHKAGVEGVMRMRSISWTHSGDTMVVCSSRAADEACSNFLLTRAGDFLDQKRLTSGKGCQNSCIHPVNGELYYNDLAEGNVWRYDYKVWGLNKNKAHAEKLFSIQDRQWEFDFAIHPTGNYVYIIVRNQHYILRSNYDWEKKDLPLPL